MMEKASERKTHPVRAVFVTCVREHALLTVVLIAVIVASIVLALLPPYILGLIVDELVAKNASVLTPAILYVAAVFGQGLAGAGQEAAIAVFGQKVTHKLRCHLCYISSFAKFFCIYNSVICFIRSCKTWEFVCMCIPVKVTAVDNRTAYCHCMSVHIFCCRMSNDICSPFKRTTVDWCCKCIVNN